MFVTAIKFMRFEKSKSIGIIVGIVISVFLIGQQLSTLGFLTTLMRSVSAHVDKKEVDIWVITNQTSNINAITPISADLTNQLMSIEGVEKTYPVLIGSATMKFDDGQFSMIQILGSPIPSLIMGPPREDIIEGDLSMLMFPSMISLDRNDVKNFHHTVYEGMEVEINGKYAKVALLTKNVKGYGASLAYASLDNARLFTGVGPGEVSAIAIKVSDKKNASLVCEQINKAFPGIRAWEREQLEESTVRYILKESNMGVSFASLVVFAAISGFFIIGLTLYTSTFDRVKDYGTMKAIGASNMYISKLILLQALLYALVGYTISIILLFVMKYSVENSGLMLVIPFTLVLGLLVLTVIISVGGSFFAVMKLRKLEPASVFK